MTTYRTIIGATEGIRKLATMDLAVQDAIKIARLIKRLDEECNLYNEQRDKICKKYGEINKEKTAYVFKKEIKEDAISAFKELDDVNVDLGEKIKITLPKDAKIDAISLLCTEELVEVIFEGDEDNG